MIKHFTRNILLFCLLFIACKCYAHIDLEISIYDDVYVPIGEYVGVDAEVVFGVPIGEIDWNWWPDDEEVEFEYQEDDGDASTGYFYSMYPGVHYVNVSAEDEYSYDQDDAFMYVIEVDKLVDWEYYNNDGPLYVPVGGEQDLFAFSLPYDEPYYVYFPSGYPEWDVNDYPEGADPDLDLWDDGYCEGGSEQDSATLYGLTVPGEYVVHAQCGEYDAGDDISVIAVGVGEIDIEYSSGSWDDVDSETIVLLKGTKYNFKAYPNPSGASWPVTPSWTGYDGTYYGETYSNLTFNAVGEYTIYAKCGSYDSGKWVHIHVVAPVPENVSFFDYSADNEHDIAGVSDPVWTRVENPYSPVSYTKNTKMSIEVDFWASEELSYSTNVYIDVNDEYNGTYSEDDSVIFGTSWPSETSTHNSDASLPDELDYYGLELTYKYKVPSGTNEWITMSSTSDIYTIYVVFDEPKGDAASNYTEANLLDVFSYITEGELNEEAEIASFLNKAVYGTVEEDEGCICDSGFQVNFDAAMGSPPTSGDKGMCCCRAEGLNCVLQLLGIGPYTHVYCNEKPEGYDIDRIWGTVDHNCWGYCTEHGDVYRWYWANGFGNRWMGVIRSGDIGTTCYSPNGDTEDTYDNITDNPTYHWYHWDGILLEYIACTEECEIDGILNYYLGEWYECDEHYEWWDRFVEE